MQALIFLILLVCLSIFWIQNPQNITLIFFGTPSYLKLSLSTWMLLFALTGAISSFFIQLLAKGTAIVKNKSPKKRKPLETPNFKELDWDNTEEDSEWEIETPPTTKTPPIPTPIEDSPKASSQPPETTEPRPIRSPSIYSYTPPTKATEPKQEVRTPPKQEIRTPQPKSGDVYDANYRVITPPYPNQDKTEESKNESDDDDWI